MQKVLVYGVKSIKYQCMDCLEVGYMEMTHNQHNFIVGPQAYITCPKLGPGASTPDECSLIYSAHNLLNTCYYMQDPFLGDNTLFCVILN